MTKVSFFTPSDYIVLVKLYLMKDKISDKTVWCNCNYLDNLTLFQSWPRDKVAKFFHISEYLVREARKLAETKGILELPEPKKGQTLSDEVPQSVLMFYQDSEYSRLTPGMKDYVSVCKKVHKQKRLLFCNLNELYAAYKDKYPNHKIGLSQFCSLQPKWCVIRCSFAMCIHQNTKTQN